MNKKLTAALFSAVVCTAGMCCVQADAATVDDVAEVARRYGYSEDMIMQGYNEYYAHPDQYTSEDFDYAISEIERSGSQIITPGPQVPAEQPTAPADENSGASSEKKEETVTVVADDGSSFDRVSRDEFIDMSYDDKLAYVRTFTPEQQQAFIDDLSPEEYRSMLKQLPSEKKLDVVDSLSKAGSSMGLNVSVNEITDDELSVALRNSEGELVGIASAGVRVEDTGYDRRGIFAGAAALFAAAAAGIVIVMKKAFGKKEVVQSNEE